MKRGFGVHGVCAEELSPTAPVLVLLFGGQSEEVLREGGREASRCLLLISHG